MPCADAMAGKSAEASSWRPDRNVQSYRNLKPSDSVGRTLRSAPVRRRLLLRDSRAFLRHQCCVAGETYTSSADTRYTFDTSVLSFTCCKPAFFGGLARNVRRY